MVKELKTNDLEDKLAKVEKLKARARERRYEGRAIEIAKVIGYEDNGVRHGHTCWSYYNTKLGLEVQHISGYSLFETEIVYKNKDVFHSNKFGRIETFLPGEWEKKFDTLYKEIKRVKEAKRKEEKNRLIKRLKDNFGV